MEAFLQTMRPWRTASSARLHISLSASSQRPQKPCRGLYPHRYSEWACQVLVDDIIELEKRLSRVNKKIDKKTAEFNAKGGQIASQSQELFAERITLNSEIDSIQENYLELATGELPLLMVKELLLSIKSKVETERENRSMSVAVKKINQMFKEYSYKTNQSSEDIAQFIKFLKKQAKKKQTKIVFDLSENVYIQLSMLLSSRLTNTQNAYISNKRNEQKNVSSTEKN